MEVSKYINKTVEIHTTEMHSGGEPLRIVESGWPAVPSNEKTLLEKRRFVQKHHDQLRRFLMHEPRGHHDMYGVLILQPDHPEADFAVLFMHNEGYSTMCGHAMMGLGRYAVDKGLIPKDRIVKPEVKVNIQCPCGLVTVWTEWKNGQSGKVRFHSVPAFAFAIDVPIQVPGTTFTPRVDIGYGGAFYAIVKDSDIGIDINKTPVYQIVERATEVSDAVKSKVKLHHPESDDLSFLYGTIVTDGKDEFSNDEETTNLTIFADREVYILLIYQNKIVDRAPTGSGVTARVAVQYTKGLIKEGQVRKFRSAANGSVYTGKVEKTVEMKDGPAMAVVVEVSGSGFYSGTSVFTAEDEDNLKDGFLVK